MERARHEGRRPGAGKASLMRPVPHRESLRATYGRKNSDGTQSMIRLLVGLIAVLAPTGEPRSQGFQSPPDYRIERDIKEQRLVGRSFTAMYGRQTCDSPYYGAFKIIPRPTVSSYKEEYKSPRPVVFQIESVVAGEGISRFYKLRAQDGVIGYLSTNLTMFIESESVESNLREGCIVLDLSPDEIAARIAAMDERDRKAREVAARERDEVARRPLKKKESNAEPGSTFDNFAGLTAMTREIKSHMRDPDSFSVARYGRKNSDGTQCMVYRSANGFGGMNVGYAVLSDKRSELNDPAFFKRMCVGL